MNGYWYSHCSKLFGGFWPLLFLSWNSYNLKRMEYYSFEAGTSIYPKYKWVHHLHTQNETGKICVPISLGSMGMGMGLRTCELWKPSDRNRWCRDLFCRTDLLYIIHLLAYTARYGNGISAKCLIYNATGTTLNFVTYNDWHGHIYDTPYPAEIQNGQWGAYLHVHPSGSIPGSAGAVVYRTQVPSSTSSCDWLFCWSIPFVGSNGVYTEIREEGHFPKHWDYIQNVKLDNSGRSSTDSGYGYVSETQIGEGTTIDARAVFKLPY